LKKKKHSKKINLFGELFLYFSDVKSESTAQLMAAAGTTYPECVQYNITQLSLVRALVHIPCCKLLQPGQNLATKVNGQSAKRPNV
jgi:hypothetical protein